MVALLFLFRSIHRLTQIRLLHSMFSLAGSLAWLEGPPLKPRFRHHADQLKEFTPPRTIRLVFDPVSAGSNQKTFHRTLPMISFDPLAIFQDF
jgi:hypothetical protein